MKKDYPIEFIKIILAFLVLLIVGNANLAAAAENKEVQSYCDDSKVIIYLPASVGDISAASAQIGNSAKAEVAVKAVSEEAGCYIHTTILFDNSLSISSENREKMKNLVKNLISSHAENELFTLATFDTEQRILADDSVDYENLLSLVDGIAFVNQDTYLKNVLYNVFKNAESSGLAYESFIVLSDGSDDNEVGYTYNEISAVLKEHSYQIYSIGSRYEKDINALEEMFSISRAGNSGYFLLDDTEDVNTIAGQITAEKPQKVAVVTIPDELKDGSKKSIKLTLTTAQGEQNFAVDAQMPFAAVEEERVETPTPDPAENEEESAEETVEQETIEKQNTIEFMGLSLQSLIGIAGGILAVLILLIFFLRKIKKSSVSVNQEDINRIMPLGKEEQDEDDDDLETTVLLKDDDMDEDDEVTVVMEASEAKNLTLIPENQNTAVLEIALEPESQVSIGRSKHCNLRIEDDKSVSGIHCVIWLDASENIWIRDEGSSNGTYLNDEKLYEEHLLESNDTVEIGRTRYSVQID